jgi:hypothetical protein
MLFHFSHVSHCLVTAPFRTSSTREAPPGSLLTNVRCPVPSPTPIVVHVKMAVAQVASDFSEDLAPEKHT